MRVGLWHFGHSGESCSQTLRIGRAQAGNSAPAKIELVRSSEEEKQSQLKRPRQEVDASENVLAVLIDAVRA